MMTRLVYTCNCPVKRQLEHACKQLYHAVHCAHAEYPKQHQRKRLVHRKAISEVKYLVQSYLVVSREGHLPDDFRPALVDRFTEVTGAAGLSTTTLCTSASGTVGLSID